MSNRGHVNVETMIGPRGRCWRAAGLMLMLSSGLCAHRLWAAEGAARGATSLPGPPGLSVAQIAAVARPSVVVIAHYGRDGKEDGVGAGFTVASNGLVATSLHVIGEGRRVTVRTSDGKTHEVGAIHAWDRQSDLAVIQIEAADLPVLELDGDGELEQGASVVAIGNPLGLEHSIVEGVVSAKRTVDGVEMIQLAIPLEPGNSGGPLLDRQGKVQGLLNMKSALTPNLGFATPVSALRALLEKPNPIPMNRWMTVGGLNHREWSPLFGARWRRKAGQIRVEGEGSGFGGRSLCLYHQPAETRPYEVAVSVRLEDEAGAAGLIFCSDGNQRHYGFYPTAGQLRLTRFDGPSIYTWTILDQKKSSHYRPGEWNRIRIRHEIDRIQCYVNEQLVFESDDDGLEPGRVGLAKFRDTRAEFKEFRVGTNLSLPASPMFRRLKDRFEREVEKGATEAELSALLEPQASRAPLLLGERIVELEKEMSMLRRVGETVHRRSVVKEIAEIFAEPDEAVDLFRAALAVSRLDNRELDPEPYCLQLEEMVAEMKTILEGEANPDNICEKLTKYLFVENGFHGSRSDYYNRANSYLNDVMDDREGLPITLSILFVELAQRVGLKTAAGVSFPGHFLVKYTAIDGRDQFLDAHNGGRLLSREELVRLAEDHGADFADEHLRAATKRETLVRLLHNLLRIAETSGRVAEALRYLDVILVLQPESVRDRGTRALMRIRDDDRVGAGEDLKWLLDRQPPGVDLDAMAELYRSLQNR